MIGRRTRCDISLRFPNVSSHHCELELLNGYWIVRDLGSRNGIKVNGTRCDSKWLMPGDVVSVAKHRFEISYTAAGTSPPPEEEDPLAIGLLEKAGLAPRKPKERPEPKFDPETKPEDWKPENNDDPVLKWLGESDEER